MRYVTWIQVVRWTGALACLSCADALGLHELAEGSDAGDESASSSNGHDDAAATSLGPLDARPTETKNPGTSAPASIQVDAMPARIRDAATSGTPIGMVTPPAAGPEEPTADAAFPLDAPIPPSGLDGGPPLDAAIATPDGGACGASGPTLHSNGLGQTFQDCAPKGTHNAAQALEACSAFTGESASCAIVSCGGAGDGAVRGAGGGAAACSTGLPVCDCWTFSGPYAGLVQSPNAKKCRPCANDGRPWN
jgi:hypothetical protein